jgi:hypothetical protein
MKPSHARASSTTPAHIDCSQGGAMCTELYSPYAFGYDKYIGHDEPSTLFYSNKAGSGNNARWQLTLPKDPQPGPNGVPQPGQSFNFQLHGAFWFGMAMCDTQSYPDYVEWPLVALEMSSGIERQIHIISVIRNFRNSI